VQILKVISLSLLTSLLLLPVFQSSSQGKITARPTPANDSFRLPRSVTPENYDLFIDPDLDKGLFKGSETIAINVAQTVDRVYLNSHGLTIESAEIHPADGRSQKAAATITVAKSDQVFTFLLSNPIEAGKYRLQVKFSGRMNDKLCGFYKVKARDSEGRTVNIGATQMEPTDARRMFPCFDEPDFKATFKLKVSVDRGNTAISNGAVAKEEKQTASAKRIVEFAATPKMSTYLVTLIVGPFASTPPLVSGSVPIRVWAVRGSEKLGIYARNAAAKMMPFFINYFAQPYPGTKLDFIAVPEFEAGAMENLGAITFREELLLLEDKHSSVQAQRRASSVIAHEMAHLWFGDLVTMKWWDDLWLNEAFATWMSVKADDFAHPEWQSWEFFTLDRLNAMEVDELRSTRAIHAEVRNPMEAIEMFDSITYSKGASILRMLETYLGEKVFQAGVQHYMREHKFGNATTGDLWNSLQAASQKPVSDIMYAWVHQPGYPVVEATRRENDTAVRLGQTRFVIDAAARTKPEVANSLWAIPICWRVLDAAQGNDAKLSFLLSSRSAPMVDLHRDKTPLLNAKAAGYYRVNYPSHWQQAILNSGLNQLNVSERITLLSDQWTLTYAGMSQPANFIHLFNEYDSQMEPQIIEQRVQMLQSLYGLIDAKTFASFERYVRARLGNAAVRFGWTAQAKESDVIRTARAQVLLAMGTIGNDPPTIAEARRQFDIYLSDPQKVDADLLDTIFKIVAFNGDEKAYQKLDNLWRTAKTPEDRVRSIMALPYFRSPQLIDRTLKFCLSNEIRLQDAPRLMDVVLSTPHGRQPGFKFVKENFQSIKKRFPIHSLPHVVGSLESLNTPLEERELTQFVAVTPIPAGRKRIQQALETVHNRVVFRERSLSELDKLLSAN
jgi:puromycin-sensitive aminopeptidase